MHLPRLQRPVNARKDRRRRCFWGRVCAEDGQALVELALVLPILVVVIFGIVEFGRAVNYNVDETHLANEAARCAAVNFSGCPTLAAIKGQADTEELKNGKTEDVKDASKLCVTYPEGTEVGKPVRAEMTVNFEWLKAFSSLFPGGPVGSTPITATATMRLETAATRIEPCA